MDPLAGSGVARTASTVRSPCWRRRRSRLRWNAASGFPCCSSGGTSARQSRFFSALAPDAASAASIWRSELDAAMRPHAETPPDSALAASLIAAFEDVVGRERFSSMVWADRNAGSIQEAEAILRALPVWVRDRELEAVWARQMEGAQADMPATGVLALATATARRRIERSARLYDAANQPAAAVFAGHGASRT